MSFVLEVNMSYSFMKLYKRTNRSVGIAFWHIQFCTKFRFKMFNKFEYKSLMEACIRRVCCKHDIRIVAMYVMADHVHLVVKTSTKANPAKIVQLIKGASSYLLLCLTSTGTSLPVSLETTHFSAWNVILL